MAFNKRRIGIPLVFLWALAHGIWMGAVWHAAGAASTPAGCNASFCGCKGAERPGTRKELSAGSKQICALCQLNTLMPDVPAVHHATLTVSATPAASSQSVHSETSGILCPLPPSRAPPVA